MSRTCVVAAGGTGGHMFPAEALAREMAGRGWRVILATDHRGEKFAHGFPADDRMFLDAATGRGPLGLIKAGLATLKGAGQARAAFRKADVRVVVGFGGYPSAPALIAALTARLPTVIHEQNAVLGRTNRLLAGRVDEVASGFPVGGRDGVHVVGSPVRPEIRPLFDRAWTPPTDGGPIRVLVTGGSQGARLLSEAVPEALAALPETLRRRLEVFQQSRAETLEAARQVYLDAGIRAEIAPFFRDMAGLLATTHLLVGRAGASTCAEIAVAATPSVLIPLAIATDDHQTQNARSLVEAGAAISVREAEATPERLASILRDVLADPARLTAMSAGARAVAIPDAAGRLADLVETTVAKRG
ncbi:MAG TPA: undecaprenyldiphospho-muramoylpentapeptide beta-N-acetylglucosaminyltransferase [Brevundimonas sp.]|jgi:UDP-N-acetylglucosamine--N-acetylmuramyl-(pentapeptide) pyrophosphoryl-undecaprenol N-acetylglucosamine transferase|uniref:undecaprenyldiphospho-muramoylpentapeptide beta-N-acetylglucosaminyltransferase n=1 Tax=Brevundimonas sp. TaxID=1871086 RepID=UPI002DF68D4E|nr:undecaprenyldiphospho-muramoylpentapeptide beta-N-acetylglucosaminyltransferase [Brevundimonas sp.]